MLNVYERYVDKTLDRPREALLIFTGMFLLSFLLIPLIGVSFFPAQMRPIRHQREGAHRNPHRKSQTTT